MSNSLPPDSTELSNKAALQAFLAEHPTAHFLRVGRYKQPLDSPKRKDNNPIPFKDWPKQPVEVLARHVVTCGKLGLVLTSLDLGVIDIDRDWREKLPQAKGALTRQCRHFFVVNSSKPHKYHIYFTVKTPFKRKHAKFGEMLSEGSQIVIHDLPTVLWEICTLKHKEKLDEQNRG